MAETKREAGETPLPKPDPGDLTVETASVRLYQMDADALVEMEAETGKSRSELIREAVRMMVRDRAFDKLEEMAKEDQRRGTHKSTSWKARFK